tara:strand:+ start:3614 stop:4054 length:441 start_codon:yes stop_codon:yes gene_type:complete
MNFLNDKRFILIIGPPNNKYALWNEIKKLYDKGEKEAKDAYDKFYKLQEGQLSKLIKDNEKETLKSLLELVIGGKIKNLKTTIGMSTLKGWVLPNISVDASNSLLENNEPLHLHLDREKLKQVSSVIGKGLNAKWMKVDNNFLGDT